MTERDDALAGLRASIGGIDPVLDASADYANAIREVQKTTRQQGHVMSLALDNNAALWELKKKLEAENRVLKNEVAGLRAHLAAKDRRLEEMQRATEKLDASGGDKWRALYEDARRTLTLYTSDAFDLPELEKRMATMKDQHDALKAQGIVAPPLPDRGVIDRHMAAAGLDERGEARGEPDTHQTLPNGLDDL